MKQSMWLVVFLASFLIAGHAYGATYYISASTGSDAQTVANVKSKTTPWAHAPGMANCALNCAKYIPVAGDRFIFKGGETWGNESFQWTWNWSGTNERRIYIGIDPSWYSGRSWSRPILTGAGAEVRGGNNLFLRLDADYVTVDNFEFTGAYWVSGYPFGGTAFINPGLSTNVTITRNYFHGWTNGDTSDSGRGIVSNSASPSLNVNMVISYNVFDGSDTVEVLADPLCMGNCKGSLFAIRSGPIVHHNVIRYVSNGYVGEAQQFNNNLLEHIRRSTNSSVHENGFENVGDPCTGLLFYNNVVRHTIAGVNIWLNPQGGCAASYAWNNVTYDTTNGNVFNVGGAGVGNPTGTAYIYNNTLQCGRESTPTHVCSACSEGTTCMYKNNHFITDNTAPVHGGTAVNNFVQTLAEANARGSTSAKTFAYSPGSDGGENLSPISTGNLIGLSRSTGYGVIYNQSSHTVSDQESISVPRPLSGPWNRGAYQTNSDYQLPIAPKGLTVQ
jgi:hypothetical protein